MQHLLPCCQKTLQSIARRAFHQHLRTLHIGYALHGHGHGGVEHHLLQHPCPAGPLAHIGAGALTRRVQKSLGRLLAAGVGAHQGLVAKGRHACLFALLQLAVRKVRVIVIFQRRIHRVRGLKSLHPHLALRAQFGITSGSSCRLQQQRKQALGRPKVAGKQSTVRVDGRHQRDAPEIMAFGNHLCAHQHIDFTRMHRRQLALQRALEPRGVRVNAANAHRFTIGLIRSLGAGAAHIGQECGEQFFNLLGATPQGQNIWVATAWAGARHALAVAAMVAAQRAVAFVKHPKRAAMPAGAFPAAVAAMEHRRIAAPVQEHQALLAACDAFFDRLQQGRRHDRVARLVRHVHPAHQRQTASGGAYAAGHVQAQVAPAFAGRAAVKPGFQRGRGRA